MPALQAKYGQQRNEQCGCGSGLKFKWCHGDAGKAAVCEHYLNEIMLRLIMKEKYKRDMITDEEYRNFLSKVKGEMEPQSVNEYEAGEILDKAKLKRCAGALCGTPIPDTEEFCMKCKEQLC
jgi:hypothetical protein